MGETDKTEPKNLRDERPVKKRNEFVVLSVVIGIVSILTIALIAAEECRQCFRTLADIEEPLLESHKKFLTYTKSLDDAHLKHVFAVLERLGYQHDPNATDWSLFWAHDYPFSAQYSKLKELKVHQKVNHFPGCGHITNKVDLATSKLKYIPAAFKLPRDKDLLLKHAGDHPNVSYVQKNNDHRNIKVMRIPDVDLETSGTFIQEFVDRPLLVSGHKFDIGIYAVITSVDPLRVYVYDGDALLRFCPVKYRPFDPENLDKYVVGDDYLPTWEVPALKYYYNNLGFGMRESLNAYLRSQRQDPTKIWSQINDAISTVFLAKEEKIIAALDKFTSKRNFFEMMRFDFVVDEELRVYLLEANMSPNLSSAHYPPNQLLYEQVLYHVMSLVGLGERIWRNPILRTELEEDMIVSDKNLATFPEECNSKLCKTGCSSPSCQLCLQCITAETVDYLKQAYREHLDRGDCKRIFPPKLDPVQEYNLDGYSPENQLQFQWFLGKCKLDSSWC